MEDLASRLSEGDLERVTAGMERLQQLGLRASQQDEVYRLQELVDDFDFMTAAEHVANMQVNLTKRGPS